MVTRLAGLLRHSLELSRAQLVPLRVEMAALEFYLEIEKVRHGNRLLVSLEVPEALRERVVPSFVLQPLVENSIRHGFGDGRRPLHVSITVREEGERLRLQVTDDGVGVGDRPGTEGIGLGNTRARLTALYGDQASIALDNQEEGGTRVVIEIPQGRGTGNVHE
jgi:LytS/YehU family sensor histidine kinase